MNIRLRLTLWYTAILSFILIIFSLAVYIGLTRSLFNVLDSHLRREVSEILDNLEFEDHEDDNEIKLDYTPGEGIYWQISAINGEPLVNASHFSEVLVNTDLNYLKQVHLENTTLVNGLPLRLYTAPFNIEEQGEGIVQVAESYRHIQEVQKQLLLILIIGIPLTLLASSLGGWFMASSALEPIDEITRMARQISAQDLRQRLNLTLPNDEVGRLASTIDQMLNRLDEAFEQQKRFTADASHELKTPLTILKGDVDVALARPRNAAYYRHTLERVNVTTDQLITLVQELLLLSRADSNYQLLNLEAFNISGLLADQVATLNPKAADKQITLQLNAPTPLTIQADKAKLSRLFTNLIDNAIKYARPQDSVTVQVTIQNKQICISVADTGPGIDPQHLPHLFERFYRIDQARTSDNSSEGSGAGLGLSIAQWLVQIHHGQLEVQSQPDQGTIFIVWLPFNQTTPTPERQTSP